MDAARVPENVMRGMLLLVGLAIAPPASAQPQTIAMAEVENRDAMAVADRLLPADIRPLVVEGILQRQFLPGNVFWAGYRTEPRPVGTDLCERTLYSVQLRGDTPPPAPPNSGTALTIGPIARKALHAVVFPARKADAESCAAAKGFVNLSGRDGARKTAAYRRLTQAMRDARGTGPLPIAIRCMPAESSACRDSRAALATLPLDALFGIEVSSGVTDVLSEGDGVRVVQRRPIVGDQTYEVALSFGMSGTDGHSWRVSWMQDRQAPREMVLTRTMVIYH